MVAQLAYVSARAGQRGQAEILKQDILRRAKGEHVSPFILAVVHIALGERDAALDWLERAYSERLWLMCVLKTDPIFDDLRDNPRFNALLHRMNLLP